VFEAEEATDPMKTSLHIRPGTPLARIFRSRDNARELVAKMASGERIIEVAGVRLKRAGKNRD